MTSAPAQGTARLTVHQRSLCLAWRVVAVFLEAGRREFSSSSDYQLLLTAAHSQTARVAAEPHPTAAPTTHNHIQTHPITRPATQPGDWTAVCATAVQPVLWLRDQRARQYLSTSHAVSVQHPVAQWSSMEGTHPSLSVQITLLTQRPVLLAAHLAGNGHNCCLLLWRENARLRHGGELPAQLVSPSRTRCAQHAHTASTATASMAVVADTDKAERVAE